MNNYLSNLEYLHHLITKKSTGNCEELAKLLGVSRRTVYNYIEVIRDHDIEIYYDRSLGSYVYGHEVEFNIQMFRRKQYE